MKQFQLSQAEVEGLTRRILLAGAVVSSVLTAMFVLLLLFLLNDPKMALDSTPFLWGAVGAFILLDMVLWVILLRPVLQLRKKGASLLLAGNTLSMKLAGRVREVPLKEVKRAVFHGDGFAVERVELFPKAGRPVTLRGYENMDGLAKALTAELPPGIIERKQRSA